MEKNNDIINEVIPNIDNIISEINMSNASKNMMHELLLMIGNEIVNNNVNIYNMDITNIMDLSTKVAKKYMDECDNNKLDTFISETQQNLNKFNVDNILNNLNSFNSNENELNEYESNENTIVDDEGNIIIDI